MNKLVSIILIVGGIVLTVYGTSSSHSISSGFSHALTGVPNNRALCLLIGGIAALALGIAGFFRGFNAR